ncbi:MAG: single-stranded DNA-binding protein [Clostridiaceae bacterium]|jgi:single-strand DNA-binding protein|nr:single-stranded DNA-binding protein [Clostridiaceae bacterium]
MNTVVLVGRVGRNAEIKYFESGKCRANFSVAVNRWDSKTKSEVADWFNVDVWDKQAEFAGEYVKKGILVAVDGRINQSKWTDKATGDDRESFSVIANNIRLLGSKRDAETV